MKLQMNIISMKKRESKKKSKKTPEKKSFTLSYVKPEAVHLYKDIVLAMQKKGYVVTQSKLFEFLTVFFDWILNDKEAILNQFLDMMNETQKIKEDEEDIYD